MSPVGNPQPSLFLSVFNDHLADRSLRSHQVVLGPLQLPRPAPWFCVYEEPWSFCSLVFKGHWSRGLHPFYSTPSRGKGPFLSPYLFMMRYVPQRIPSATVMVNLIRCDGGPTTRAAARAAEARPVSCHITRDGGPPHLTTQAPSRLAQIYRDLCSKTVVHIFSHVEETSSVCGCRS